MTGDSTGRSSGGGRPPHPIYNWLSVTGLFLAACGMTTVVFFLLVGLVSRESGYGGLMAVPPLAVALLGVLVTLAGWLRERWRQKHGRHSSFLGTWVFRPFAFLRGAGLGMATVVVMAGTLIVLGAGVGSLAVVEYSESNSFCGNTCHEVMSPEATAHADSAHSRVACVECHVGEGGDSYLRAKLGGLRQVWAVATGRIDRPIHTPIRNRRPSREMCESCHAPDRLIGYQTSDHRYYVSGEETRPLKLLMLAKVGGGRADGANGGAGIHYHMLTANKVEYIARDEKRQDIAWVRSIDRDGEIKEYAKKGSPLADGERAALETRTMECVDCHSRPAHRFESPVDSMNAALAAGLVSSKLPRIKEAGVRALDGGYETTDAAMTGIAAHIRAFYEEEQPKVLQEHPEAIEQSIEALRGIYRRTIFPEMKAGWDAHADNIGHLDSPGCFRCHNDEMVDREGETILTDCTGCHTILAQGETVIESSTEIDTGQPFVHPEDSETIDEYTDCTECHSGGAKVYE